jgi:hypothetical protein
MYAPRHAGAGGANMGHGGFPPAFATTKASAGRIGLHAGNPRTPSCSLWVLGVPDGALSDGGVGRGSLFGLGQLLFVDGGVVQGRAGQVFHGEDGSVFLGPGYLQRRVVP